MGGEGRSKRARNLYENTKKDSLLEPVLTWVPLNTIQDRVFVMEEIPGLKEQVLNEGAEYNAVVLVKKWPMWADGFMGEGDPVLPEE